MALGELHGLLKPLAYFVLPASLFKRLVGLGHAVFRPAWNPIRMNGCSLSCVPVILVESGQEEHVTKCDGISDMDACGQA